MTPFIVEGWNPLEGNIPRSDDDFFELLTAAVFQARFRPDIVRQRWPGIRTAFFEFDLNRVADWSDDRVGDLLNSAGMIRNEKKIRATLRNARELARLSRRFGSVRGYLESLGNDPEAWVRDIDTWAHYIGAPSIRWFVQAARTRPHPQ